MDSRPGFTHILEYLIIDHSKAIKVHEYLIKTNKKCQLKQLLLVKDGAVQTPKV